MKCPKCQHVNPGDAKFCNECANKLELVCPKCGKSNPAGSRFCNECAQSLAIPLSEKLPEALPFEEKIDKIKRYLPKGLTEKILSQKEKIEGERKQVTVMFCDMEGFTGLTERLGPEQAYSIMDQVYEILIHKVRDYEGTVNEMTGDGIMALFGAPIALEDAPQRAIRSAMAIHREIVKLSDTLRQDSEAVTSIKMRIGIHTGPVVVGTLGNDLRVEFKAVGDTVNLASRVEGLGEPGSTLVTVDTFKLTEGLFRFEALGDKEVKGKKEPVKVYRVIAPSTRRTRFDVSAERGLTSFVGRERELELLLDGFERAKAGRGQAFSIMAEAGVGKSRLLYEFRKAVTSADVMFLEARCLSYSSGVAYHPVIESLKANFDIHDSDGDSNIREKVAKGLKILGVDEASTLPYILELFSVKESGLEKISLSREARKDRIIEAIKRISLKGSEIRPLILAYEDLHWVDKSSEDVLKYVLESIPGVRVLMIFTYRPEFVHTWGGRSYHSQLTLNRLSNRESLAMVNHILGTGKIDSDLEDLILEKTEGVPFFIEEFIRSLKDLKIIKKKDNKYHLAREIQGMTIPSTIQDVIMSRVDSLPDGAKEVLQTGSVIEREFGYELIKRVTGLKEKKLLSHLSALKDSELLYERGIFPKSTYIFKHNLTREVVYDSLLSKRKKKLHEMTGNAAEELYRENIDEHYEVLAAHFIYGENYEKGAEYSGLAGRKAAKSGSLNDAISYVQKRIACLEKIPVTEDLQKKIIDARTALGLYILQLNHPVEAKEAVGPITDIAVSSGYKRRLSQIYTIMGVYNLYAEENFSKAFMYLESALKISDETNDVVSSFLARHWLGVALSLNCEFEKAFYYIGKALDIATAAKNLWGISVMKSTLSYWVFNVQGKVNLGYQTSHETVRIAEESGDIYSKAAAYATHGISCLYKGFFEEAREHLLKGINFCERINLFLWDASDHNYSAEAYICIGEYQKSKHHYDKAIGILENGKFSRSWINLKKISLATAKVMNNERDIDLESLHGYVTENKLKVNDGRIKRNICEILFNLDDRQMSEAEAWINKAIETDKKNGTMWNLGRDYKVYAELLRRKSDLRRAKKKLNKAIEIFKECGADGWVEKIEEELVSLS